MVPIKYLGHVDVLRIEHRAWYLVPGLGAKILNHLVSGLGAKTLGTKILVAKILGAKSHAVHDFHFINTANANMWVQTILYRTLSCTVVDLHLTQT